MPVPAEATPQPGQRFLMLPSASSPLARLIMNDDSDDDDIAPILAKDGRKPLYKAAGPSPRT